MTLILYRSRDAGSHHLVPLYQEERTRKTQECTHRSIHRKILSVDRSSMKYIFSLFSGKGISRKKDIRRKVLIHTDGG